MLKFGNQEFRNLEEQVFKNQQDIQDFKDGNQTIAEFGITVVGILSSVDQLPASGDNFGDAYLIGTKTPYDMRVWTRNIPEQRAEWVDLGAFPLQGPKGDKGDKGSQIYSGNGLPTLTGQEGDAYINTATGILYQYEGTEWKEKFSIKGPMGPRGLQGPQGIQGPRGVTGLTGPIGPRGLQGPQGDYGPSFNIQGTLASTANLPTPTADMKSKGYSYIIPDAAGVKHVWVIQGTDTLQWTDLGPSGVQGERGPQGIGIDTLTDLNLTLGDTTVQYDTTEGIQLTSTGRATYNGEQHDFTTNLDLPIIGKDGITIDKAADSEKIEISGSGLLLKPANTASAGQYNLKVVDSLGNQRDMMLSNSPDGVGAVYRPLGGRIFGYCEDTTRYDTPLTLTNKKYVDDNYVKKLENTSSFDKVYTVKKATQEQSFTYIDDDGSAIGGSLPIYVDATVGETEPDGSGRLVCYTPVQPWQVANKKYVDEAIAAGTGTLQFKTLFGNQSIIGEGNIDLYKHHVKLTFTSSTFTGDFYTDIISSQNFTIDSLTDLKTYLGDSFTKDIYGTLEYNNTYRSGSFMTSTTVYYSDTDGALKSQLISNYTITDTVTTI